MCHALDLVHTAGTGTLIVIEAAASSKSVHRLILTSSTGAVAPTRNPPSGALYTDKDWNSEATLETAAYQYSKVDILLLVHHRCSAPSIAKRWSVNLVVRCTADLHFIDD